VGEEVDRGTRSFMGRERWAWKGRAEAAAIQDKKRMPWDGKVSRGAGSSQGLNAEDEKCPRHLGFFTWLKRREKGKINS